jgi:hypothetical protein
MCDFSEHPHHGHFVIATNEAVLTSKAKRDAARKRPCGKRGSVCAFLGFMRGVISEEQYRAFIQESADEDVFT